MSQMDTQIRKATQKVYDDLYRQYIQSVESGKQAEARQDYTTFNEEMSNQHVLMSLTGALRRSLVHNERPLIKSFIHNEFSMWVASCEQHNTLISTREQDKIDPYES